jgi:hypothetical protein
VEERSAKLNEANSTLSSASLQELKRSLLAPVDLATSKS